MSAPADDVQGGYQLAIAHVRSSLQHRPMQTITCPACDAELDPETVPAHLYEHNVQALPGLVPSVLTIDVPAITFDGDDPERGAE